MLAKNSVKSPSKISKLGLNMLCGDGKSRMIGINKILIPVLGASIFLLLIYMVYDLATRPLAEGFSDKITELKRGGLKNGKNMKKTINPNQSKLSALKRGVYNPNQDLKNYGMDGGKSNKLENKDETLDAEISNLGTELGESTLNSLAAEKSKGKRDNFKNVLNEIDNINPGAFDLSSIGGTIRRYNENFNNRLNYVKSKNKGDNLETTMAQGKIIFDEFKKIFLFTDMFS